MSSTFCMFVRHTSLFGINQCSYFISQMSFVTTVSEGHLGSICTDMLVHCPKAKLTVLW